MRALIAGVTAFGLLAAAPVLAQEKLRPTTDAQINYQGFRGLTAEVEAYRADRLAAYFTRYRAKLSRA